MALDTTDLLASHVALLDKSFAQHADRVAVVQDDQSTTYRQLHHAAQGVAAQLAAAGVGRGDAVALSLGNQPSYLAADLALLRDGIVKVPLNQMLVGEDVRHIVEHSGAKVVLTTPEQADALPRDGDRIAGTGARILDLDVTPPGGASDLPVLVGDPVDHPDPDAPAAYFYTGGTTGRSKGVVHTHRSLAWNLLSHVLEADVRDGEQMLLATPLSHAAGVFAQTGLLRGATLHLLERFESAAVTAAIEDGGVSWTWSVPTMIYRLLDHLRERGGLRRGGLDTLVYGAAPIVGSRLREALETFGPVLVQLYGQTEVPNFGTTLSKADHARALDDPSLLTSCGKASTLAAVKIVDDDGRTVFDEAGEVCLTAPYVMREYLRNPEATATTLRDGWVHTGDIGVMDHRGYVHLRDRKADMIISGGMNVYTTEVEAALAQLGDVSQVAVIGIPDDDWGEAVTAVIVARGELDRDRLDAHARTHLAAYKRPKRIEVVDTIPVTPFGKPDKKALRARYWKDTGRQIS